MSVRDRSGHAREDSSSRGCTRSRRTSTASPTPPSVRPPAPGSWPWPPSARPSRSRSPALKRLLAARDRTAAPARWRSRLTAGLAGAAMAVTALATLVAVSADARPGDALYGAQARHRADPAGPGRRRPRPDPARLRQHPARRAGARGRGVDCPAAPAGPAEGAVLAPAPTPRWCSRRSDDGRPDHRGRRLADRPRRDAPRRPRRSRTWRAGRRTSPTTWPRSRPGSPAATAEAEAAQASLVLLADITTRVTGLRSALDCAGGPAVDGADALGPVPGAVRCRSRRPRPPGGSGTSTLDRARAGHAGAVRPAGDDDRTRCRSPAGRPGGTGGPARRWRARHRSGRRRGADERPAPAGTAVAGAARLPPLPELPGQGAEATRARPARRSSASRRRP